MMSRFIKTNLASSLVSYYEIPIGDLIINSSKSYIIKTNDGDYVYKNVHPTTEYKYQFLYDSKASNVLYPRLNNMHNYVSKSGINHYYLTPYKEVKSQTEDHEVMKLFTELRKLHQTTSLKKQLTSRTSRPKFDEITSNLDYRFKAIEDFIRRLESDKLNDLSIKALGNYQHIINAKNELFTLERRIITKVKDKLSVDYSYLHNRPEASHLLNTLDGSYFISLDNGKIGIPSLDLAKVYVTYSHLDLDFKSIIQSELDDEFSFDYFKFLVLFIYIKKINLDFNYEKKIDSIYHVSKKIIRYFEHFSDQKKEIHNINKT